MGFARGQWHPYRSDAPGGSGLRAHQATGSEPKAQSPERTECWEHDERGSGLLGAVPMRGKSGKLKAGGSA